MKLNEAIKATKKPINNLLIADVESTCWGSKKEQGSQKNEIIQLGFCPVKNLKLGKKDSIFIKPKYSKVSDFCTKLTSITKEEVNSKGFIYKKAYNKIKNVFNKFSVWASWGDYDKKQFLRMFNLYKISSVLPSKYINIRSLFASKILNSSNAYDAPNNPLDAMKKLNMSFIGRNHRGEDDAYNIARLYIELVKK